jgi:plasmid maintenance system antidote protein VapI
MSNRSRLHPFHHLESRRRAREKQRWPDIRLAGVTDDDLLGGHWTMKDVAMALKTTKPRLKSLLSGRGRMSYGEGLKLCRLLKLDPWFLLRLLDYRRLSLKAGVDSSALSPRPTPPEAPVLPR